MRMRQQRGFTLTEMGILLLVIVATLGIALPVLVIEQRRSQFEAAMEQLRQMPDPILLWLRDADPFSDSSLRMLVGPGKVPAAGVTSPSEVGDLLMAMTQGNPPGVNSRRGPWHGPYVSSLPVDPWGHAYTLVGLRAEDEHLWILTAGPNGILETTPEHLSLHGDDLGARLR